MLHQHSIIGLLLLLLLLLWGETCIVIRLDQVARSGWHRRLHRIATVNLLLLLLLLLL